jgi:hypothetical protein
VGTGGVLCSNIDVLDKETRLCRPLREEEKVDAMASGNLYERDITKVDSQRWGSVADHEFLFPTTSRVYATQEEAGIRVLPKDIGVVVLTYLALPNRPKFVYTKDARHNIICDNALSVGIPWGQEMLPEIMSRLKTKYASFVSNPQKYEEGTRETSLIGS